MLVWLRASSISAFTAVMASGVSCKFCARNCAVTTISFGAASSAGASGASASCANAGVAQSARPIVAMLDVKAQGAMRRDRWRRAILCLLYQTVAWTAGGAVGLVSRAYETLRTTARIAAAATIVRG